VIKYKVHITEFKVHISPIEHCLEVEDEEHLKNFVVIFVFIEFVLFDVSRNVMVLFAKNIKP
jgi:hypothetical protein